MRFLEALIARKLFLAPKARMKPNSKLESLNTAPPPGARSVQMGVKAEK